LRQARIVVVLALLGLCGLPGVALASPESRMLTKINEARAVQGLGPLRTVPNLQRSAGAFARWLISHNDFKHRPAISVTRAYPHCGEALAMHYSLQANVGGTIASWMGSSAHRELVLTNTMNLVGLGHASGRSAGKPRTIWVLQVARRR
jgi:uncharacterized protein YkwD